MAKAWFIYLGQGDGLLPEQYQRSELAPTCIQGRTLCAIYADSDGSTTPKIISANISRYIATGRATGLPQPSTPVGSAKYVYFLPLR